MSEEQQPQTTPEKDASSDAIRPRETATSSGATGKWVGVAPRVSKEVFEGIEAVLKTGRTSRYKRSRVALIALELGHPAAAEWIMEDKSRYAAALFNGFTVPDDEGEIGADDAAGGEAAGGSAKSNRPSSS
jgi:hypothetical protein